MTADKDAMERARKAYKERAFDRAAAAFREALKRAPDDLAALFGLGNALLEARQDADALAPLERAAEVAPGNADVRNSLGIAYRRLKRYREAIPHLEAAAEAYPDRAGILTNLANAYRADHRLREAALAYRRALDQDDQFIEACFGLGTTHRMAGRLAEAKTMLDRALTLDPAHADARFSRALLFLEQGNFTSGFADYEHRWASSDFPGRRIAGAEWQGEDLDGKTILVHAEQGIGDTIQFARFIPALAARGARVVAYVQPDLASLVATVAGVAEVVPAGTEPPPYDYYVAVMSLPYHLGTVPATIPAAVPYLAAPADAARSLASLLPPDSDDIRVGLVWAGRAIHSNDRHRSCRLQDLLPVLEAPGVSFFSLQKDPRPEDDAHLSRVTDLAPYLTDFGVTAAVMDRLDLVVSVDSAPAHLAGALGRPVWLILPYRAEWRWALAAETSPWYPTMRIVWQSAPGDWAALAERLQKSLRQVPRRTA